MERREERWGKRGEEREERGEKRERKRKRRRKERGGERGERDDPGPKSPKWFRSWGENLACSKKTHRVASQNLKSQGLDRFLTGSPLRFFKQVPKCQIGRVTNQENPTFQIPRHLACKECPLRFCKESNLKNLLFKRKIFRSFRNLTYAMRNRPNCQDALHIF